MPEDSTRIDWWLLALLLAGFTFYGWLIMYAAEWFAAGFYK